MGEEKARNILKQESVIESLRDDYENAMRDSEEVHGANKQLKEALEVLHSKLAIAEHTNMELKKKIDTEAGFYAASETTLKNSLSVLQADNETLKETANNLDSDFKKKSTDFLALTKKLHTEHLEHQKIVKQLNDFREPLILEERKLRREEKASRKQKAKAKQEKTKSDVSEDSTLGDDDFHCTICAQPFPKSELSSKSVPEESDTCKTCNNHEFDTIETLDEELEPNTKPTEDSTRTEPLTPNSPSLPFQNSKLMSDKKFKELTEKHFGPIASQSILEVFAKVEENSE